MDLSIIIVSFNTKELTLQCVHSIVGHIAGKCAYEIIVVDNKSQDGTQEALKPLCSKQENLLLIEAQANLGFAKANNIGIRRAQGRQILLLNSDTYFIDDSVLTAVGYVDEHATVFGCGCTLLNADKSVGISYGAFPELGIVLLELLIGRFGAFRAAVPKRCNAVYPIDFPCGAFFLMKRNLLDAIGLLDEGFFMYCEETDLAKRACKAGYSVVYFGPAAIVHLRGQSGAAGLAPLRPGEKPLDLKKIFYQSWKRYLVKHRSSREAALVGLFVSLYFKAHSFIFSLLKNHAAKASHERELQALREGWNAAVE